jgi:hypothetical protein
MKAATAWSSNTAKDASLMAYSDASVAYSSATQSYSSSLATLDDRAQTPAVWATTAKPVTIWQANPAAHVNEYAYDSPIFVYDLVNQTYDGIGADLDTGNTNVPTIWSAS